jgi:hypothetical protein
MSWLRAGLNEAIDDEINILICVWGQVAIYPTIQCGGLNCVTLWDGKPYCLVSLEQSHTGIVWWWCCRGRQGGQQAGGSYDLSTT